MNLVLSVIKTNLFIMSLFADELKSIDRDIKNTTCKIEEYENTVIKLSCKYDKLKRRKKNYKSFLARYATMIGGPDGIFGVLSDEIVVLILSYLPPKQLLECCCKRFHTLRDYALELMPCIIPKVIVDKCVNILRIPAAIIHAHARRRSTARIPYVVGKPLVLTLTSRSLVSNFYNRPMNYKYEITEGGITLYMDSGSKSLCRVATIYNESVVTYEFDFIVMVCKDFGFKVVTMSLKPIDMHPMFDLYNKREIK